MANRTLPRLRAEQQLARAHFPDAAVLSVPRAERQPVMAEPMHAFRAERRVVMVQSVRVADLLALRVEQQVVMAYSLTELMNPSMCKYRLEVVKVAALLALRAEQQVVMVRCLTESMHPSVWKRPPRKCRQRCRGQLLPWVRTCGAEASMSLRHRTCLPPRRC
mmetsp:Transcript_136265/g.435992  ORF Transcript_136265/g.435992 Transcript_136265/m.435992 type:complete len:163 (-) Transcript_136265:3325-3813(-)